MRNTVFAYVVLVSLTACSSLGLAPAQTFDQKLAYTYVGVTTALNTISTATSAGQLSSTQASLANQMVLNVKRVLDAARLAEGADVPDMSAAQKDLDLAIQALTAVQSYLIKNGVKS